jgi:hypothetical protein
MGTNIEFLIDKEFKFCFDFFTYLSLFADLINSYLFFRKIILCSTITGLGLKNFQFIVFVE